MTLALGVLVSGGGTNLQAILDAIREGRLDAEVKLVLSNKPGVRALERAEAHGAPTRVISHKGVASRDAFDAQLVEALREAGAEWIVLAGFMRVVTPVLLGAFPDRVVNIHPALLPAFPGVNAQKQALEHGAKLTGCTTHFVDAGVDSGPIIAQRALDILEGEDEDSLRERLLRVEHQLMVDTLNAIAAGRVEIVRPDSGSEARAYVRVKAA